MTVLRALLRILGWLLTPLVAWAASFLGAALGALLAAQVAEPRAGLVVTVAVGFLAGVAGILGWLRVLRRSPKLRETLAVTEEGAPLAVVESESEKESDS